MAYGDDVAVLVLRVPTWTLELAAELYAETMELTGGANPRTIVEMRLAEPGARVRKRLAELQDDLDRRHPAPFERRVAVITDSPVMRGAITALGWVSRDVLRGFARRDALAAARWVAHAPAHADAIHERYLRCSAAAGQG